MTRFSIKYYSLLFFAVVLASACKKDPKNPEPTPASHIGDATKYDASIAINWINQFRDIAKTHNSPLRNRAKD